MHTVGLCVLLSGGPAKTVLFLLVSLSSDPHKTKQRSSLKNKRPTNAYAHSLSPPRKGRMAAAGRMAASAGSARLTGFSFRSPISFLEDRRTYRPLSAYPNVSTPSCPGIRPAGAVTDQILPHRGSPKNKSDKAPSCTMQWCRSPPAPKGPNHTSRRTNLHQLGERVAVEDAVAEQSEAGADKPSQASCPHPSTCRETSIKNTTKSLCPL